MVKRLSFLSGLLLGSVLCAWFLGAALVYFLSGKLISLQTGSQGFKVALNEITLFETPAQVREEA